MNTIKVYVEAGIKRTIASAMDWPGWCRIGRDEPSALQALVDYGPRYARVLQPAKIEFQPPADVSALVIIERLAGSAATDFGVPERLLASDKEPVDSMELERFRILLAACWQAFDRTVRQAAGKELRKGPRGGGRETEEIVQHVVNADQAYLGRLGWKQKEEGDKSLDEELRLSRMAILRALEASVKGELPAQGPRGGVIWPARYYVRRAAWHVLDHAWEIEDRMV